MSSKITSFIMLIALLGILAGCSASGEINSQTQASGPQAGEELSQAAADPAGESEPGEPVLPVLPENEDFVEDEAFYRDILLIYGGEMRTDQDEEPYLSSEVMGLYYASDWQNPQELSVGDYFTWYLTMVWKEDLSLEELWEKYRSPHGPETGWFFPQELFEPLVMRYFDVSEEHLRSDPLIYDADNQGYYIGAGGGIGAVPAIVLDKVETDGDLRRLHLTLEYGDEGWAPDNEKKILTVRLAPDGSFRFESYVTDSPD